MSNPLKDPMDDTHSQDYKPRGRGFYSKLGFLCLIIGGIVVSVLYLAGVLKP